MRLHNQESNIFSTLTSIHNPRIKNVVKLRNRSHRENMALMIIEGYREVKRALDNQHMLLDLFFCESMFAGEKEKEIIQICKKNGVKLFNCSDQVFSKLAYKNNPEGLLAVAPQIDKTIKDIKVSSESLIIIAESVEKPGNIGTIIRSADAAGANGVIVCDPSTDINNPNVVRASIGAIFSIPVITSTTTETILWLTDNNFKIISATPCAEKIYDEIDMTGNTAIVVGSEQHGLSNAWMQHDISAIVKIPMLGQSDSLNVASAATILLFEAVRQRRK